MTTAIMLSRQVFLALTIVDDNTMLARPLLSITSLFFFVLSLYHHWLSLCELTREIFDLLHALTCAAVPFWYLGVIVGKSLAFGIGIKL
jgi:hypothetical protein